MTPCGHPASNQKLPEEGTHQLDRRSQSVGVVEGGEEGGGRERVERNEVKAADVSLPQEPSILTTKPREVSASCSALMTTGEEEGDAMEIVVRARHVAASTFRVEGRECSD